MEKTRYLISDAANIVNVESHVLRYWEDELELNVPRNELGHRYYTNDNIEEFQRIKELKEQGYQLKAIRMIVHNGPIDEFSVDVGDGSTSMAGVNPSVMPKPAVAAKPAPDSPMLTRVPPVATAAGKPTAEKPTAEKPSSAVPTAVGTLPAVEQPSRTSKYPQAVRAQETQQSILNNTDKMAQFTTLMTQIVGKALAANNQELSQNISDEVGKQVVKEMNYLMREREEQEEERFRKLDAAIRGSIKSKEEKKGMFKKKKPSQP